MGEAKRRKALDPTWGVITAEMLTAGAEMLETQNKPFFPIQKSMEEKGFTGSPISKPRFSTFPNTKHSAQEWVDFFFDPRTPNSDRDLVKAQGSSIVQFRQHIVGVSKYLSKKRNKGLVSGTTWPIKDWVIVRGIHY